MKSKKYLNFLTSIILIAGMILGSISVGFAADLSTGGQFGDVNGHWAKAQIESGVANGFIKGYADSTFKPDNNITRAEFFTMVNRAFGYTEKADVNYSDVSKENWFYSEIEKAKAIGYVAGYTDGTIKPNNNITREEAAAIISRIMDLSEAKDASVLNKFSDSVRFADWSKGYIGAIAQEGYMGGYPDGTFKSERNITRAESVSMLNRVVGALYKTAGTYGSESEKTVIEGNVTVSTTGVVLKNMEIKGNLYLTEGIGDGDFTMDNVEVAGKTLVKGGGPNSIVVLNSKLGIVIVNTKTGTVRVVAKGNSSVGRVVLNSGAKLEEDGVTGDGFGNVDLSLNIPEGEEVIFVGNFAEVKVAAPGVKVNVVSGTIGKMEIAAEAKGATVALGTSAKVKTMTINAPVSVTGKGKVEKAVVNSNEVSFENKPDEVEKGEGIEDPNYGNQGSNGNGGNTNPGSTSTVSITNIDNIQLLKGAQKSITVTATPGTAQVSTVLSSNESVATVSNTGNTVTVAAKATGTATITVKATASGYTEGTKTFTVKVIDVVPIDHTLPSLLSAIEVAFTSLTDAQWQELKSYRDGFYNDAAGNKLTLDQIIVSLQQANIRDPFEALINSNITDAEARATMSIIIGLSYLGRDNVDESISTISSEIAALKQSYQAEVQRLLNQGVNQQEIYDYAIDVYNAILSTTSIPSDANEYEKFLYNTALNVLRTNSNHDSLELVCKNAYERAQSYYAGQTSGGVNGIIGSITFDQLDGTVVLLAKDYVAGNSNQDFQDLISLLDFMLQTSKTFIK